MEAELTALVTSGATTVVTLMASDAWNAMRSRIVELLRRDSATQQDPGGVETEVESERRGVIAAREGGDPMVIADLEAVWRVRLALLIGNMTDPPTVQITRGVQLHLLETLGIEVTRTRWPQT
jgi:hypothetical protein